MATVAVVTETWAVVHAWTVMHTRAEMMHSRPAVMHAGAAIMHARAAVHAGTAHVAAHAATAMAAHAATAMAATHPGQSRRREKNEAESRKSCDQALHDFPPMEMPTE